MPFTRTAIEAAGESPRIEAAVRAMLDELETVVFVKLSAPNGNAPAPPDPRATARLIVATTRGLAVMERANHSPASLKEIAKALVTSLAGS
ncbi:hypothetical protein [Amycolatopsis sp. NPDC051903]|uniref:LmrA/YxaF family transcription factor n=1 Tax=Amycolatopsis sp. NPDC051903 TaxID=3363936 RepID=UPI0037ACAE90